VTFVLREISEVKTKADGTVDDVKYAKQLTLGLEEWERVIKSGGDLSVLGIRVTTDKPIEHFEKAWQRG
jgi:hypothetical protein